jgi:hypothetical protein
MCLRPAPSEEIVAVAPDGTGLYPADRILNLAVPGFIRAARHFPCTS